MVYQPSAHYAYKEYDVEIPRRGSPLLAHIYQPQGSGPFPIMMDIHGGAWSNGDRFNDKWIAQPLAESGVVVVSPEFRIGPRDPHPGQQQDINLATRWAKAHAKELNGDANSIGGMGFSSGGHTVVLAAMRYDRPEYTAEPLPSDGSVDASLRYVVSCWPVIDPLARYEWAKANGRQNLVDSHDGYFLNVETMIDANPPRILERGEQCALPNLLVCHGTADDNVPIDLVRRFVAAWNKAGGKAELDEFEGQPHGFGRSGGEVQERLTNAIKGAIQRNVAAVLV